MVAESCKCYAISSETRTKGSARNGNISHLLPALNDKSIILLEQIFLECHDSLSNYRLAVFLSSKWPFVRHKFIMNGTVKGESGQEYTLDVCIYDRNTGELVGLGLQNNNTEQTPTQNETLLAFLRAVSDLRAMHPRLNSACYASSYGYEDKNASSLVKQAQTNRVSGEVEIRLLEYRHTVYFEHKS